MINKTTKTFQNLCSFIEQLPEIFDGIGEGYQGIGEKLHKYNIALEAAIRPLLWQIDQYLNIYQKDIELKIKSILFLNDRFLLAYDIENSVNASNDLRKELKQYTDYMVPEERQLHEQRYMILDLFCTLFGLYGISASIQALKKETGITGFDFMTKQLKLERTAIKKGAPLQEIKAICKASKKYKLEDNIMLINASLIELKKRGIDLKITPLDLAKVRPNTATVKEMIEKKDFIDSQMLGEFSLTIWEAPHVYRNRFMENQEKYLNKLLEEERYLHPDAYARRFGED